MLWLGRSGAAWPTAASILGRTGKTGGPVISLSTGGNIPLHGLTGPIDPVLTQIDVARMPSAA
jgi:hypothetical protein